jgi:DNA modification methylase
MRTLLAKRLSWDLPSRTALTLLHPFPAPMPLSLARTIIGACTDPESVLLDPMAGSGTVLTAARQMGRICHSFDLDPLSVLMM